MGNIEKKADFLCESLTEGLKLDRQIEIGLDRVITFMGDELRVYETPSMIADIEYACRDLLFDSLPEGWDSVGILVDIEHLAATPLGERVSVQVEIVKVKDRRVRFKCSVHDSEELAGRGFHDRFIVDISKHRKRVINKRVRMQGK